MNLESGAKRHTVNFVLLKEEQNMLDQLVLLISIKRGKVVTRSLVCRGLIELGLKYSDEL